MAQALLLKSGGGGTRSDDLTGYASQALAGYTFVTKDSDDEAISGQIPLSAVKTENGGTLETYSGTSSITPSVNEQTFQTNNKYLASNLTVAAIPSQHSDSGNVTLSGSTASKSYVAGWYSNAHGAAITTQTKSVTPSTQAQTVSADTNKVITSVSVAAIPNQKSDSGNVTLSGSSTSKSYAAGYYLNAHGAAITTQTKSATPSTSAQTISADTNKVLTSVSIAAIPNQKSDSGNVSLTSNGASKSYAAGYYANAHGAVVSIAYADW